MTNLFAITLLPRVVAGDAHPTAAAFDPVSFSLDQLALIRWLASGDGTEEEMLRRCDGLARGVAELVNALEGRDAAKRRDVWLRAARELVEARKADAS